MANSHKEGRICHQERLCKAKKKKAFTSNKNCNWGNEQEFGFWIKLDTWYKDNLENVYKTLKKKK